MFFHFSHLTSLLFLHLVVLALSSVVLCISSGVRASFLHNLRLKCLYSSGLSGFLSIIWSFIAAIHKSSHKSLCSLWTVSLMSNSVEYEAACPCRILYHEDRVSYLSRNMFSEKHLPGLFVLRVFLFCFCLYLLYKAQNCPSSTLHWPGSPLFWYLGWKL